jgi:hypothetical protein
MDPSLLARRRKRDEREKTIPAQPLKAQELRRHTLKGSREIRYFTGLAFLLVRLAQHWQAREFEGDDHARVLTTKASGQWHCAKCAQVTAYAMQFERHKNCKPRRTVILRWHALCQALCLASK